jgi:hypothetical protein
MIKDRFDATQMQFLRVRSGYQLIVHRQDEDAPTTQSKKRKI